MNQLLRVGFDMTPTGSPSAGISRYTRDLSAALGRAPGVHIERLLAPDGAGSPPTHRVLRTARRTVAYYPALLDRTAVHRDVDVIHCPGPMLPSNGWPAGAAPITRSVACSVPSVARSA